MGKMMHHNSRAFAEDMMSDFLPEEDYKMRLNTAIRVVREGAPPASAAQSYLVKLEDILNATSAASGGVR